MANQIIVSEDRNQITVVEGETRIVEVVTQGPQGPVGPSGPAGPSGSSILNQITSGSVTASVDIGSNVFRISSGAQPYLGLTYENSGVMRHQNSTPPYFTIFNNNGGVNMTPGAIGFIEIGGQRGGGGGTMVRFSGTYIGDGNSRNARLSIGTAQGTGFGTNQISIFKLSSGSFTNQPITIIGTSVDSYSTSSIDITGSYASRATTIINGGTGNSIVSFDYNGVPQTVLFPNGNWGINTFVDDGQKLQVSGSTRLSGDATITGSLTVTGNITAQTLVVQTITSSVSFITGSTKFGSLSTNTHEFTGSVLVSGSVAFGGSTGLYWDNTNGRLGIGTNSPVNTLQVKGEGATSSTTSLLIQDSTNTHLFSVNNIGHITVSSNQQSKQARFYVNGYTIYPFLSAASTGVILSSASNNNLGLQGNPIQFYNGAGSSEVMRLVTSTGNLIIQNGGTFTDNGQRLQVYGDTLLRGSGATSATTALTVQNSSSQNILRARNDGALIFGVGDARISSTINGSINVNANNLAFTSGELSGTNYQFYFNNIYVNLTTTSGISGGINIVNGFAPTSGTGVFNTLAINNTINQTGGANGITRGLYVNPTLTAAADFRAIETTAGNVLFGSNFFWDNANGRLGIGTNTPAYALDVSVPLSGAIRVRSRTANNNNNAFVYIDSANNVSYSSLAFTRAGLTPTWEINTYHNDASFGVLQNAVVFSRNGSQSLTLTATSNLLLNGTADNGQRLQVYGDTLLRGSGATSATTALTVQNSSSTNLFTVRNDGRVDIGAGGWLIIGESQRYLYRYASAGIFTICNNSAIGASIDLYGSTHPTNANHILLNGARVNITSASVLMTSLPTSSAGLPSGALWNDAGTVKIV